MCQVSGRFTKSATLNEMETNILFSCLNLSVEARTSLDNNVDRDDLQRKIVRPPANLLVFEGDCLDSEASELDSYLVNFYIPLIATTNLAIIYFHTETVIVICAMQLATCDFYGDFLLLDPCDAPAVFEFLQGKFSDKENSVAHQGSSTPSKSRLNVFTSPNGRSGGTGRKSALGKLQGDLDPTQENPGQSNAEATPDNKNTNLDDNYWSDPVDPVLPADYLPDPDDLEDHVDPVADDSDDDDDPWKPLNPHEPGNIKIKPYRGTENIFY